MLQEWDLVEKAKIYHAMGMYPEDSIMAALVERVKELEEEKHTDIEA